MKLRSYPKVYNLGHKVIADLFKNPVVVQEKVDGSQFSFGIHDGVLCCRSRNNALDMSAPPKMFKAAIEQVQKRAHLLHPGWTYRGEYLSKPMHNTLAYDRVPKGNIILFDVDEGHESYSTPLQVAGEAERLGLEAIPTFFDGMVISLDQVREFMERISVLGGQTIEGIVFKNYERFAPDGHALMGKHVSERFKEMHGKDWKNRNPSGKDIKGQIGDAFRTEARWEKAVQHLKEAGILVGEPKDIGPLMKELGDDLEAECVDEIKERLWKWARKDILRAVRAGVAQWYKDRLAVQQFEKGGDT